MDDVAVQVGAIREAIAGLPDDAPAFVTVAGWDLSITWTNQTQVIDPPDAARGSDGRWPTRPGLEIQAGLTALSEGEADTVRTRVVREVADSIVGPTDLGHHRVASALGLARVDWPERVEFARSIAVRLDGELADLRRAIESIHTPKAVPMESTPEEPEIICSVCRTEYPCETRSFSDRLDPINAIDEFSDQPDPF